jgi:hypothetical protein
MASLDAGEGRLEDARDAIALAVLFFIDALPTPDISKEHASPGAR